jgi:CRP-like cAMP-binding protein
MAPGADVPADSLGKQFAAGDVLFREGEPGQFLYVIQQGSVRLTRQLGGREVTVGELGDGDFVGEVGVVCDAQTATATAVSPTSCLLVDAPALEEMVTNDAEIGVRFIRGLIERLAASQRQLDLVVGPAAARVALAIARRAEQEGSREPDGIMVARRLRDIGGEAGLDETELSEVSKLLVRERLVRIKRNGVLVPDVHRMYEFVKSATDAATQNERA